jgi:exosortase/archaeosortase family protein
VSPVPSCDNQVQQPGSVFAFAFILCVISVAGLMSYIQDSCLDAWRELTIQVTKGLGVLVGLTMTSKADILTVNGFAMRIVDQCTAAEYVAILATAMLLYTRHSLPYRLLGIAIAVPVIVFSNACRLIITGVVGTFSRSAFDFVHDYLWVIAFALLVFALWTLWVNARFSISRSAALRVALIAAISLATYGFLLFFHDAFSNLTAHTSSLFYKLLNDDPHGSIINAGDLMVYSRPGTKYFLNSLLEQLNVAVYVGLMVPLQKKGDWEMLVVSILGLVAIFVTSAIFIALGCSHAVSSGAGSLTDFLKVGGFVNLALPMTIYWIMASERSKRDGSAALPVSSLPATGRVPGKSAGKAKRQLNPRP